MYRVAVMPIGPCAIVPMHGGRWLSGFIFASSLLGCRAEPQPAYAAATESPAPEVRAPAAPASDALAESSEGSQPSPAVAAASASAAADHSAADRDGSGADHADPTSPPESHAREPGVDPPPSASPLPHEPDETPAVNPDVGGTTDGAPRVPSPDAPLKVLILGDSLAATGFGALLERTLDDHPDVRAFRRGKSSSGLARPDFFDWMAESKRQVELRQPDLVVVIMGGNDGQDLTESRGGARVRWNTPQWRDAYAERVRAFVAAVHGSGANLLWLGLPRTGTVKFERKLELIRAVQQEVVASAGATYIDTSPFLLDDDGHLLREAPVGSQSRPQRLREDDGIHFTMGGSRFFAAKVYPAVLEALRIEDAEPSEK